MPGSVFYRSGGFTGSISVQGFAALQRVLREIGDGTDVELRRRIKEIGDRVALVAAGNAPRRTGELQHSITDSVALTRASVYSTSVYGGALNFGAWVGHRRGVHISRTRASHYMDRAVTETAPWVHEEMDKVLDWVMSTFQED